jgi:hypothetical protein
MAGTGSLGRRMGWNSLEHSPLSEAAGLQVNKTGRAEVFKKGLSLTTEWPIVKHLLGKKKGRELMAFTPDACSRATKRAYEDRHQDRHEDRRVCTMCGWRSTAA